MAISKEAYARLLLEKGVIEGYDCRAHYQMPWIKHQWSCVMCWTIAPTDAVAIGLHITGAHPTLDDLSSSEVLDCYKFQELALKKGYTGSINKCFKYMMDKGAERTSVKIKGYVNLDSEDEFTIMKAVSTEYPICGAINWDEGFQDLKGEIYKGGDDQFYRPHAIVIVGFDYDPIQDLRYWIIKNSYGEGWGINGYGKIARKSSLAREKSLICRTSKPLFFI